MPEIMGAQEYIDRLEAERDTLAAEVERLQGVADDSDTELLCQDKCIKRLTAGLHAVSYLIENSQGVAGLHLNGDVAPWDDLLTGGAFEGWLGDFSAALAGEGEGTG